MPEPLRTSTCFSVKGSKQNGLRRIAVVGTGYVGLVTGACLAELGNSVVCVDNDAGKIQTLRRGEIPFFEPSLLELTRRNHCAGRLSFSEDLAAAVRDCAIIFIAVGTPTRPDDNADLSAICNVAAIIGRGLNGPKIVVLKSTVPVETCEFVSAIIAENAAEHYCVEVVSNPEFLREGSAVADFMYPDRIVIGADNPKAEAAIRDLYAPLNAPFVVTDHRTSEMIKYAANAFLATKISFMNEIANICDLVGVDIQAVSDGIAVDRRIGSLFMSPGIGYGGSCFPKDVLALERVAHGLSYDASLLRAVDGINRRQVERVCDKIRKALGGTLLGKNACVLGLSFKPNTSDIREAPALRLIDLLVQKGASVAAHDPVAIEGARKNLRALVAYRSDMYEAIKGADVLILATEWEEYRSIDFGLVRKVMRGDLVFDGRNIFDPAKVARVGLRYMGVGRAKEPSHAARAKEPSDAARARERSVAGSTSQSARILAG